MPGHDKITPQGKIFFKEIKELKKLQTRVGFTVNGKGYGQKHEAVTAEADEDGTTLAEIAAWNELGTKRSPSRPFIRNSVDNNASRISTMCKNQLRAIAKGEATAGKALKSLGALQVGLIQNEIRNGSFESNAESTIRKKKSDKPLIDTGRMRQSVHYVIKPKGED